MPDDEKKPNGDKSERTNSILSYVFLGLVTLAVAVGVKIAPKDMKDDVKDGAKSWWKNWISRLFGGKKP